MSDKPRSRSFFGYVKLAGGVLLSAVVSFFVTVYLARVLGPRGFGIAAVGLALVDYFALGIDGGRRIWMDAVVGDTAQAPGIVGGMLLVRLAGVALCAPLFLLSAWLLGDTSAVRLVLALYGLKLLAVAVESSWARTGLQQHGVVAATNTLSMLLYAGAIGFLVGGPEDLYRVPLALLLGEGLVALGFSLQLLTRRRQRPDLGRAWGLLRRSLFPTASQALQMALLTADLLLIELLLGGPHAGIYSAAYRIGFLVLNLGLVLHQAYVPEFLSAARRDAAAARAVLGRSLGLLWTLLLPLLIGGSLLAGPLIAMFFSPDFAPAAPILRLLLVGIALRLARVMLRSAFLVKQRLGLEAAILGLAVVANVAGNLYAIPRWGLYGAAIATLLAELGVLVASVGFSSSVRLLARPERLLGPLLSALLMAAGVAWLGQGWPVLLRVAWGAGLYAAGLVLTGALPDEAKDLLRR